MKEKWIYFRNEVVLVGNEGVELGEKCLFPGCQRVRKVDDRDVDGGVGEGDLAGPPQYSKLFLNSGDVVLCQTVVEAY